MIILGLVLVVVAGLGVMAFRHYLPTESEAILVEEVQPQGQVKTERAGQVIVHVAGAVKREGVYKLKFGDRIIDAINLAGGAAGLADLSSINLADKVKDGQKISIPVKRILVERVSGERGNRGSGTTSSFGGKVNINSASKKELCKIKGVGATTAKRIIEYRSANGSFSKIDDIMKVKSIGKGKFGKIKGQIRI